jgi:iron-sulfur cluster repair protein YtfE (RIC family)
VSLSREEPPIRPAAPEASPVTTPARNVSDFLGGDHRRLEAILSAVEGLVESSAFVEAAARFAEFARGLSRHIDMEETVLFPAFEEKTGMTTGPTSVMRAEHVEIRRLLAVLTGALALSDASAFSASERQLHEVLGAHNDKEERILYPLSDRMAGGERERDELVRKMQAI